jgi:hypothetical protein
MEQFTIEIQWKLWPSILHQWHSQSACYIKRRICVIIWLGFTSTSTVKLNSLNKMCARCWCLPALRGKQDQDMQQKFTETTCWTVSQKKQAHFPPVSEHRITVLSQIVIMLVENYVDWIPRVEIYKKKKGQIVSCMLQFMLDDRSLRQHEEM